MIEIPTRLPSVVLRAWSPAHQDDLVRQANDRAVWRNLMDGFPHPYTAADAAGWISFVAAVAPSLHLCIEVDGVAAGGIGIIVGEGTGRMTGQFGYWLGRAHWGQGIATAAGLAMVDHARRRMEVVRLEAPVYAWNPASMRVLEKIGFTREGVLRQSVFKDGQLIDSVMFALILDRA